MKSQLVNSIATQTLIKLLLLLYKKKFNQTKLQMYFYLILSYFCLSKLEDNCDITSVFVMMIILYKMKMDN